MRCPDVSPAVDVAGILSLAVTTGPGWDDFDWAEVEAAVASWTQSQRGEAVRWAGTEHMRASDNNVKRRPRPDFFPAHWK